MHDEPLSGRGGRDEARALEQRLLDPRVDDAQAQVADDARGFGAGGPSVCTRTVAAPCFTVMGTLTGSPWSVAL